MNNINTLITRIEQSEGLVNVKDLLREGFSKALIDQSIDEGHYHRLTSWIYLTPEAAEDKMFLIRVFSNNAIFSHETALSFHGLSDSKMRTYVVTAPNGYGSIHLKTIGVKVHFMKHDLYKLGIIEAKTPYGRSIQLYNVERTLCDILRNNNDIVPEVLEEALVRYAAREDKNLDLLASYAKQFRIEGLLKSYNALLGYE